MSLLISAFKPLLVACIAGCLLLPGTAFAEGSKELSANGGYRALLASLGPNTTPNASFLFPTNGTMKVYVKAGETLYLGSSVQGINSGTINLRAPNGNTYSSGSSTTIGLIANRSQEMAGPLPNAGGYTPYTRTVQAAEAGVWEIDFMAENGGTPAAENPQPVAANANWSQKSGPYIDAFDVSVRNAAGALVTGRVYTNVFCGILGDWDVGFNGVFKILTQDGFIYNLDNNGQAGNGFSFFVNNKGLRKSDGTPSYTSLNTTTNPNIQDPRAADTESDITYKIFFNTPSSDLPLTANVPGGGTTWLLNPILTPTLSATTFTGTEGTPGKGGVAPLGGVFNFTANRNGTFSLMIDVNNNGLFTDAADRRINGTVTSGANAIAWDGLDGLGNKVAAGANYDASLNVTLFGGEVHFPFFDVERNVNGIKLTRLNGPSAPDFTVYWDDSPITISGTPSSPIKNTTGINSQLNGHKWGTPGNTNGDFGDEKSIDTWSYTASTQLGNNVAAQLQQADLEVTDITAGTVGGCIGQQIAYTFSVRNNGPSNVTGSKLTFTFPAGLTNVTVAHTATIGVSNVSGETTTATGYSAFLDIDDGAVHTYTITGKVNAMPGGGTLQVTAAILRPADVTDPDATNADSAPPTNAATECDAAPSGKGCNNIKTNQLAFIPPPDAGKDQAVFLNEAATLSATGDGAWKQSGTAPAVAVIAAPNAASTAVTGLTTIGVYTFVRTNANGCTDTATITVVPKKLNIPTAVTPNGDGKNDTFIIPNIELFPGSQLFIYNRWGGEVYRSDNYKNNWDGGNLAEGTYYYVLNRKEPSGSITSFKGWVFLKR